FFAKEHPMFHIASALLVGTSFLLARGQPGAAQTKLTEAVVPSADGVRIAYTAGGKGEPALLFIHGGLADRTFWAAQLEPLAARHRVVALDLAGHGASGRDRKHWTFEAFGEDVKAVADATGLGKIVLVGNSMGGPVALAATRLMPARVVAVGGVGTVLAFSVQRAGARFFDAAPAGWANIPPAAAGLGRPRPLLR